MRKKTIFESRRTNFFGLREEKQSEIIYEVIEQAKEKRSKKLKKEILDDYPMNVLNKIANYIFSEKIIKTNSWEFHTLCRSFAFFFTFEIILSHQKMEIFLKLILLILSREQIIFNNLVIKDVISGLATSIKVNEFRAFIVNRSSLIHLLKYATSQSVCSKLRIFFINILDTSDDIHMLFDDDELMKQIRILSANHATTETDDLIGIELLVMLLDIILKKNATIRERLFNDEPSFIISLIPKIRTIVSKTKHRIIFEKIKKIYFFYLLGTFPFHDLDMECTEYLDYMELVSHIFCSQIEQVVGKKDHFIFEEGDLEYLSLIEYEFSEYLTNSCGIQDKFIWNMIKLSQSIADHLVDNHLKVIEPRRNLELRRVFLNIYGKCLLNTENNDRSHYEIFFNHFCDDLRASTVSTKLSDYDP
ncbi:hypothetical protein RF11_15256 [Thelohanellus kitauei]|uniref:Uncharacterized protein n=1 Tax=Thelohanellus kitauei TaxID=669202 RepID=A0A0C2MR70_THEKT|nr:hypothetical protein RF11_15256 [Thelohanellus kitauei]